MSQMVVTAFERHVQQQLDLLNILAAAFGQAGIEYRVVGGMAVFLQVEERDPMAARATKDVDVAVDRRDLARIADAVRPFGFEYRHAAGVDMLVVAEQPRARSAVHLLFVGEKVRPGDPEPVPGFSSPARTASGILLAPVAALVLMKLTSYRLKDRVHLKDLDGVGLITPEIEAGLPEVLRERLREVRATE